jgi:hypothetical protein
MVTTWQPVVIGLSAGVFIADEFKQVRRRLTATSNLLMDCQSSLALPLMPFPPPCWHLVLGYRVFLSGGERDLVYGH